MPKPQEFLIVVDDDGIPKRDKMLTESTQLHAQMRQVILNYYHSNSEYFSKVFLNHLNEITSA